MPSSMFRPIGFAVVLGKKNVWVYFQGINCYTGTVLGLRGESQFSVLPFFLLTLQVDSLRCPPYNADNYGLSTILFGMDQIVIACAHFHSSVQSKAHS